jgi:hypothetical protein
MTVSHRVAPVAVGEVDGSAAGGGSWEYHRPQPGLIPGKLHGHTGNDSLASGDIYGGYFAGGLRCEVGVQKRLK